MNKDLEIQLRIFSIIETIKKKCQGKEWNKFYGDTVCRIFIEFIAKEVAGSYRVVGPNAYICGFPTEFDILIVDATARHIRFTNAFRPQEVKCGIESKAHGIFAGRADIKNQIKKIKDCFVKVNEKHPDILFFYLTYEEVTNPKRESSIKYLMETEKELAPYEVFCLKDSRSHERFPLEWQRMTLFLKKHLFGQNIS